MNIEEMKFFKKEFLPHIYFLLAFLLFFSIIQQSIPLSDQFLTYQALIWWLLLFGYYGFIKRYSKWVLLKAKNIFFVKK